jgi:hypothetical protein
VSRAVAGIALLALGAGIVVRAIPFALTDFPINDGGMFVALTRAIVEDGWGLPATVAWNGGDMPFLYPPLAFYGAGVLTSVLGLDVFDVLRWVPLVTSVLIIPVVFLLGRELLRSDLGGAVSALAYALPPSSYVSVIAGGGVARSPGLLIALVALWQLVVLVRDPSRGRAVLVGVLGGLTALVHPGAAVFLAGSGALFLLAEARTRSAWLNAAGALGIGLAVIAPWLLVVIGQHGLDALLDIPSNGPNLPFAILTLFAARATALPFFDPLAVIATVMGIVCLVRGRWFYPLWLVWGVVLSPQYSMVPFGVLIGSAVVLLVSRREAAREVATAGVGRLAPTFGLGLVAACLIFEGAASSAAVYDPWAPVHAVSENRRETMAWVTSNVEPGARFAVITNSTWPSDMDSEWFPLLTEQVSVATVQGSEMYGREDFDEARRVFHELQTCVREESVGCVEDWLAEHPADYLYLPFGQLHGPSSPEDCCEALRSLLAADPGFEPIHADSQTPVVFRVVH